MPKVLFIAYDFPPCSNIGASLRSEKFVKYLSDFGWQATVLTSEQRTQKKECYTPITRIPSLTPWKKPFNLAPYGWLPQLFLQGRRWMRQDIFDLIYISCPPFPPAMAARWLKKHAGIPLILDLRDAWSVGPYFQKKSLSYILKKSFFSAMEKKVLEEVDWLIVNCPSALTEYLNTFPYLDGRVSLIPNGYDEEDFVTFQPTRSNPHLNLLYAGSFSIAGRNPTPLLKALQQIVKEKDNINLQIIGDYGMETKNVLTKLGLQNHVRLGGRVSHSEVIQAMAQSDCLIVYQQENRAVVTPVAGKTYEYLRSGKAILAILPPGDNQDIIQEFAPRFEVARPNDIPGIKQAIKSLLYDWENNDLTFSLPSKEYLENFNRKTLTARLVEIFNHLAGNSA